MSVYDSGKRHRTGKHAHGVRHRGGHGHRDRRWPHSHRGKPPGFAFEFQIDYMGMPTDWGLNSFRPRWVSSDDSETQHFECDNLAQLPTTGRRTADGWEIAGVSIPLSQSTWVLQWKDDSGVFSSSGRNTLPMTAADCIEGVSPLTWLFEN